MSRVASPDKPRRTRAVRPWEWAHPAEPVERELRSVLAPPGSGRPPVLFVPGLRGSASDFAEHWLERTAERGYPAYAMSLRGQGASGPAPRGKRTLLREYAHDVLQVATSLPRQCVLVGYDTGALVVTQVLSRYPARAGVLVAPVGVPGARGTLRLMFRAPDLAAAALFSRGREPAQAGSPVLVAGDPDDRRSPRKALDRLAQRYNGQPMFLPGAGHDLPRGRRWQEPIDAVLDWVDETLGAPTPAVTPV